MAASTRRPGTGRAAVYIDGLNLYNSALRHSTSRWLDIEKFAHTVAAPDQVASVMYVTGRLNPDDASDRESPKRQRHYLKALSARGGVEVVAHNFVVPTESRVVSRGGVGSIELILRCLQRSPLSWMLSTRLLGLSGVSWFDCRKKR